MSGDGGLEVALGGARLALQHDDGLTLTLVGERTSIDAGVARWPDALRRRAGVAAAEHVLPMDVDTARALRQGRGSSMHQAIELVASGRAGAVVSGGNTGALMALSRQRLGMLPGIERPALMAALPVPGGTVWVLDLGANIGVDARRLLEFARLGHTAVRVLSERNPAIGLLNIGREPGKGPDVVREAARLIAAEPEIDYYGFVEADQVFAGQVDLVVCDGFAGNVLIKGAEGIVRLLFAELRRSVGRGALAWVIRRPMQRLHDRLDPARHNGAPLLGLQGVVIKSHGGSCQRGFASAIGLAALEMRHKLVPKLEQALWASY